MCSLRGALFRAPSTVRQEADLQEGQVQRRLLPFGHLERPVWRRACETFQEAGEEVFWWEVTKKLSDLGDISR